MLVTLVTVILGGHLFHLQIDPSVDMLFSKKSSEYQFYEAMRTKYGSDQMIALAIETENLFTLEHLLLVKTLTLEIQKNPVVERVLSLSNTQILKHKFLGVKTQPVLEDLFEGEQTLIQLKEEVLSSELYVHNLISPSGKIANILIYLKPLVKDKGSVGAFITQLRKMLREIEKPGGVRFYMAGAPVEQYEFIRLIRKDQMIFIPMITLLLILITFIIYRSVPCVIVAMTTVFMTLIWTMGSIALFGAELNLVTSLLAPVIMIITIVNVIHLINLFFEVRVHHRSLKNSVVLTMDKLGVPCFLTHVTTLFGFLSLALNSVPAIKSFGIFAALGTFYSYVISLAMTPLLMPILPYRPEIRETKAGHFFNQVIIGFLEKLEVRWKWRILGLTVIGILLSVYGIRNIQVDTNIVKQMKPDLPIAVSTRFIDQNITGVYSLGFIIRRKDGEPLADGESLRQIDAFKQFLEDDAHITNVNSITTLIKTINSAREDSKEAYVIPDEEAMLRRYFRKIKNSKDASAWQFISQDLKEVRMEAHMKAVGTQDGYAVEDRARNYLQAKMGDSFTFEITGNVVLLGKMTKNLVQQQVKSFVSAFFAILLIITLIFRSVRMGLYAAIPNLLPILAIYGLMGFLGIELSSVTAMISSIVLGLVVDSSIHFLHRFREELVHRQHYLQALHHTYRNVGQSLLVSTTILAAGFASSLFASFKPTIYFGVLTSLTIIFALFCTLVVLPTALVAFKPFGRSFLFSRSSLNG